MTSFPHDAVVHFPSDEWWTAIFMPGASPDLHVDIATPGRLDGEQIRTIDLDLDLVRSDGEIAIHDQDEFALHRREHHYDDETMAAAQDAAVQVLKLIRTRQFPFDRSHEQMWDVLNASAPGAH
jgi:protein associated with RNAse G/E